MRERRVDRHGGIVKRADRRWIVQVCVNGRRIQRTARGAANESDALPGLRRLRRGVERGKLTADDRQTVRKFLDLWLAQVARPRISSSASQTGRPDRETAAELRRRVAMVRVILRE